MTTSTARPLPKNRAEAENRVIELITTRGLQKDKAFRRAAIVASKDKKIEKAFVIGAKLASYAIAKCWLTASTTTALAFSFTGQTDPKLVRDNGSVTLSTPKGRTGR